MELDGLFDLSVIMAGGILVDDLPRANPALTSARIYTNRVLVISNILKSDFLRPHGSSRSLAVTRRAQNSAKPGGIAGKYIATLLLGKNFV